MNRHRICRGSIRIDTHPLQREYNSLSLLSCCRSEHAFQPRTQTAGRLSRNPSPTKPPISQLVLVNAYRQFDKKGIGHSDSGFHLKPSAGVRPWYFGWKWKKRKEFSCCLRQGWPSERSPERFPRTVTTMETTSVSVERLSSIAPARMTCIDSARLSSIARSRSLLDDPSCNGDLNSQTIEDNRSTLERGWHPSRWMSVASLARK
jgi:hypothetical protein